MFFAKFYKTTLRMAHIPDVEERYVARQLFRSFGGSDYGVVNNLLIPYSHSIGSSQIDHVVVSRYGIFCIETKSHKGWIVAQRAKNLFTQILARQRYSILPNPVSQNYSHILALEELLGSQIQAPIVSIVVFPSANRFTIEGYTNVGSIDDLITTIQSYREVHYTHREAAAIINRLCSANMRSPEALKIHIQSVRQAMRPRHTPHVR